MKLQDTTKMIITGPDRGSLIFVKIITTIIIHIHCEGENTPCYVDDPD